MGLFGSSRPKRTREQPEEGVEDKYEEEPDDEEDEDEDEDYTRHKKEIDSMSTKQLLRLWIFRDYDTNEETIATDYDELIEIAKEVN